MTDRERDVETAYSVVGQTNDFFKPMWLQFAPEYGWDGAPCSEIACCISYMAGNVNKIPISNYAAGLVAKFKAAGMFGKEPAVGAFIFFDYHDGNGPSHTGRVVAIKNGKVYTVEGNIGGKVVERSYIDGHAYIYGYGWPAYKQEEKPEPEPEPEPEPKPEEPEVEKKPTFKDVPKTDSGYKAIEWLASEGAIKGYKDGTYKPDQPCTRRQIAVILWRLAGKPEPEE